ncbi:adenosylcobinamide-GDP ribazoletransferase [Thermophagus sp. OGC60D27]|uniref:adenosylcobinamide-GDP ribazoletransferase n=1 Tax=Thermophagus sp. OGC60D27 TaxID=3458415 RepID=UPI004037940B
MLKRELQIVYSSFLYFTRLSLPIRVEYRKENQHLALTWFPLVGVVVGLMGGVAYYLASMVFPASVAVVLALGVTILVTGAFHEDGFADVCDAFGGGYTAEQRLHIMKDSRVGTYAVLGLLLLLAMKMVLLTETDSSVVPAVLVASHALSRWSVLIIAMRWPYARPSGASKSRDTSHPLSAGRFFIATVLGVVPLIYFCSWWLLVSVPMVIISALMAGRWFKARIGGYTGDCLGAVQQLNEVLVMAVLFVVLQ